MEDAEELGIEKIGSFMNGLRKDINAVRKAIEPDNNNGLAEGNVNKLKVIKQICDPVLAFDQIMEEIGIEQYLKPEPLYHYGRPGYNRVNMLKTILFGFMDTGYASKKRTGQGEAEIVFGFYRSQSL